MESMLKSSKARTQIASFVFVGKGSRDSCCSVNSARTGFTVRAFYSNSFQHINSDQKMLQILRGLILYDSLIKDVVSV